jgi:hypothetical protein
VLCEEQSALHTTAGLVSTSYITTIGKSVGKKPEYVQVIEEYKKWLPKYEKDEE